MPDYTLGAENNTKCVNLVFTDSQLPIAESHIKYEQKQRNDPHPTYYTGRTIDYHWGVFLSTLGQNIEKLAKQT